MRGLALTQWQINFGLMIFLAVSGFAQTLILFVKGNQSAIAFGVGGLVYTLLAVSYRRGWEPARHIAVVAIVAIVGGFLYEPFLSKIQTAEIFLPAVVALILAGPAWVVGTGALMIGIIALRTGGESVYLIPDNLVTYIMIIGGMVFSRLAVDSAQRLVDANTRADQARAEAEQRAEQLAQRNNQLQTLLVENAAQRSAIHELSAPLLPVADHTLVLPLVGALDTARLLLAQERALAAIYERRARALIVDVTGVPVLDTQVARGLVEMVRAVRLLGAQVLLVGIRSEVAQTLITLGLDLDELLVDRDVQAALARIWDDLGRTPLV